MQAVATLDYTPNASRDEELESFYYVHCSFIEPVRDTIMDAIIIIKNPPVYQK